MVQLNPVPVFGAKKIPVPFDGNFLRYFRTNGKHSLLSVLCLPKYFLQVTFVVLVVIPCNLVMRPVTYEAAARVSFNKPDFE